MINSIANHSVPDSVVWSRSSSAPTDSDGARLYLDSQSRNIEPPYSPQTRHSHSTSTSSRTAHTYSPTSPAYIQACRDSTVSTTLRPAFR
jgi:hypothetical protein